MEDFERDIANYAIKPISGNESDVQPMFKDIKFDNNLQIIQKMIDHLLVRFPFAIFRINNRYLVYDAFRHKS